MAQKEELGNMSFLRCEAKERIKNSQLMNVFNLIKWELLRKSMGKLGRSQVMGQMDMNPTIELRRSYKDDRQIPKNSHCFFKNALLFSFSIQPLLSSQKPDLLFKKSSSTVSWPICLSRLSNESGLKLNLGKAYCTDIIGSDVIHLQRGKICIPFYIFKASLLVTKKIQLR